MAPIDVRRAADRFATTTDWLDSHSCFSFGEHYDPDNIRHGALLVSNDEVLRSGSGFDNHPHRDAEIVTWVLSGSLVHRDSAGHSGVIYPGLAQRMTAGSGIVHSERNDAFQIDPDRAVVPVHYVQMWIAPDESGTTPGYQQHDLDLADLGRGWLPVASGSDPEAAISLGSKGSTLWVSRLGPGETRILPAGPYVHLYLAVGEVDLEEVGVLKAGDSVRLVDAGGLRLTGVAEAEVLVWDLAMPFGGAR